tara:strand:- start:34165 stop:34377 length:213 start_codon:yes stop_codon:yes gene_type:complete
MKLRIVRPIELAELLSVSTVTLWRMEKRGQLPPRRQISSRIVGWLESELVEWLKTRPNADDNDRMEELEK